MTAEGASFDLAKRIAALGFSRGAFARRLMELGDDREEKNILRSIQRMIAGDARISGEIRALIGLMEEIQRATGAPRFRVDDEDDPI